jgi:NTP pyrophosphatase (non-canonical NTP hydrolase)
MSDEKLLDVELEIADVAIYLIRLADVLGIDISEAVRKKLAINEFRF